MFVVLVRATAFLLFLAALAGAQQTLTTTNAAGASVVIVVTIDAQGLPLTQTIQTLAPAQAPPVPTPPVEEGGGPVAQPAPTPTVAGQPTPYTYTTTNAAGEYTAVEAVFTPVFTTMPTQTPTGTGTVLAYDDWLKIVGTNTIVVNGAAHFVFYPCLLAGLAIALPILRFLRLL